jgi:hypothetical protein
LLAVLVTLLLCSVAVAKCPVGTIQGLADDHCYSISEHALNWNSAEQQCVFKGGHLISVTNAVVEVLFQSLVADEIAPSYWTGGYNEDSRAISKWHWSDGRRWSYTNWAKGQPASASANISCVAFNGTSGQWFAADCVIPLAYICEVAPADGYVTGPPLPPLLPTLAPSTPPPKCPSGWFTVASSNLCYNVFQNFKNWRHALQDCESHNGLLASVPSQNVQMDIQAQVWAAIGYYTRCWIGLNINATDNNQKWVDGSPLTYTNWEQNQPNIGAVFMNMNFNAQWDTVEYSGDEHYFYLCEKAPFIDRNNVLTSQ